MCKYFEEVRNWNYLNILNSIRVRAILIIQLVVICNFCRTVRILLFILFLLRVMVILWYVYGQRIHCVYCIQIQFSVRDRYVCVKIFPSSESVGGGINNEGKVIIYLPRRGGHSRRRISGSATRTYKAVWHVFNLMHTF